MSKRQPNFGLKAFLAMTRHPVLASVTAVLVVYIGQILFDASATDLLSFLGINEPSSEQTAVLSLILAIGVAACVGYLIHNEKQKNKLSLKVNQLSEQNKQLEHANSVLHTNNNCYVPQEVGLTDAWRNYDEAKEKIREAILDTSTREISILIHCETELIDGSQGVVGYTFKQLALRKDGAQPTAVRILFPAKDNPYYTDPEYGLRKRANDRSRDRDDYFSSEEEYISTRMNRFRAKHDKLVAGMNKYMADGLRNVSLKEHKQIYLYNLIFVDRKVFVQFDTYKNSLSNAPILLFQDIRRSNDLSRTYFHAFKKHFEDMWRQSI